MEHTHEESDGKASHSTMPTIDWSGFLEHAANQELENQREEGGGRPQFVAKECGELALDLVEFLHRLASLLCVGKQLQIAHSGPSVAPTERTLPLPLADLFDLVRVLRLLLEVPVQNSDQAALEQKRKRQRRRDAPEAGRQTGKANVSVGQLERARARVFALTFRCGWRKRMRGWACTRPPSDDP